MFVFPRTAHATSTAQQNASPSSPQDHQETGVRRFRNCTVSGETPAEGPNKHTHQVIRHHLVSNMSSVHSSRLLAGWRDGYLTLCARERGVNSHTLPLCDCALWWISLDQQLPAFHFKGESLPSFPHYVQRIVYMILFYFRFFCMWFDHDIFCINVSAALYMKWIKGLLGV